MQLRIFTEPQEGADYGTLLAVAQATEQLGFDAFFRSDHYLAMGTEGLPGPTDAWTTLAGIARETSTIRLGTLMTSATFRHPGPLAIQVAQVDQMSGGRVELGLGCGWFEAEHVAMGIPFPPLRERYDQFEEHVGTSIKDHFGTYEYVHHLSGRRITSDIFPMHHLAFQSGCIHAENIGGDIDAVLNIRCVIGFSMYTSLPALTASSTIGKC